MQEHCVCTSSIGEFFLTAILFALLSIIAMGKDVTTEKADVILHNGTIYTVDNDFSIAEAVAIKGKTIIAVGAGKEILGCKDANTIIIDLHGLTAVPGLVDAHAHMTMYAAGLDQINAIGARSPEEVAAKVAAKANKAGPGEWITGHGWDSNDWADRSFPTCAPLDKAAPDNPVFLTKQDGHSCWVNSKALQLAGINSDTRDPEGGTIIRDADGNPSGVLVDTAMELVRRLIPPTSKSRMKALLAQAVGNWLSVGLIGIHDMGGSPAEAALVKELIDEGNFPFRVYFHYDNTLKNLEELISAGPVSYGDGRLEIRAVKAYIDGSLGSHSAALLQPYTDRADDKGLLIMNQDDLQDLTERCLKAGFQVATHACGDRGARIVLNAYENALKNAPAPGHRLRIEHAQLIAPEDFRRFSSLGVLPSMQPSHCTSDFPWGIDLLGRKRAEGAYAWRSFIDAGSIVPCGSDFPVEDINPIQGFYAAVTRQHEDGTPQAGYFPEQRMTREEALKGFTIWAAYAAFAEETHGSIETGKRADLVVLDRDIMKIAPREIVGAKVILTMIDGKIVYHSRSVAVDN